jgi:hypothetical protein
VAASSRLMITEAERRRFMRNLILLAPDSKTMLTLTRAIPALCHAPGYQATRSTGQVVARLRVWVHAGLDRTELRDQFWIGDLGEPLHLSAIQDCRLIEHVQRTQVEHPAVPVDVGGVI